MRNRESNRTRRRANFRATIAIGAAITLLSPIQASAQGACAKTDEIRVMIFASLFNQMVTYIAQDAGQFAKNCLNATLVPVNSGPAGLAQLQAGSLHFSDSSFDNTLVARHRGLPIKVVVGESGGVPYSIVARKDLQTPNEKIGYPALMKDLVGKKVGVFGLGTGSEAFVKTLFRGAGLDPKAATYVAVGSTPTQLAALENNAVDAVIMGDPAQDIAQQAGYGRIVLDLRQSGVGPKAIQNLFGTFQVKVASDTLIKENPDLVKRYVKANQDAVTWIRDPANFSKLLKLMKARVNLGREIPNGEAVFTNLVKLYAGYSSASISRASVAAWNDFQIAAENIPAAIPLTDVVWSGAPISE
jgi:NitT/TauT family transport system substrate-binding protein